MTKARIYRWPIQAAMGSFALMLTLTFKSLSALETETDAINTVCKSREQAEIGVGFYQKLIDRNKVLYQVLGAESDGGYCFTAEGEYMPTILDIGVFNTLKAKREFCRSLAHKLE